MDSTITTKQLNMDTFKGKEGVYANELIPALHYYLPQIKILSLDCFDTILWRKTAVPNDVFYDLQHSPSFQAKRITGAQRMATELFARYFKFVTRGTYEVFLQDIYQHFSSATPDDVESLVEDEIKAEIATCYAFPPIVKLIREAKQCGLKIIIVSNTYFNEKQLRRLLENVLPADAMQAIEQIFCSSEYGDSKGGQLFQMALRKLNIPANYFLHIGDDYLADYNKSKTAGMHSLHLMQFNTPTTELLRLQNTAGLFSIPAIRYARSLTSPFRGVFATTIPSAKNPETSIGYMSLGPIFYAFAQFISEYVNELKQSRKSVKVLFLLRDGYLPSQACQALLGYEIGKSVRISRFTATAASFRSKTDVEKFLAEYLTILPFNYICRQLLLPQEMADKIIQVANASKYPGYTLSQQILQENVLQEIFTQSAAFRNRLKKYLQKTANVEKGDTLLFVDIGYAGTAQQVLSPVLQDEMGIEPILGCYIMLLNMQGWHQYRRGLVDPSWCDDRIMTLTGADVSLIEQFCCSGDESVVDYDAEGEPIGIKSPIKNDQLSKIKKIQDECVRFIRDAKNFFAEANITFPITNLRDYALSELTRLLYLPTENEFEFLQGFSHDKNKGYQETFQVSNMFPQELTQLRRQGALYYNQHPHPLRAANVEFTLSLMAKRRYGLDINLDDRTLRQEWVKIILVQNQQTIQHTCNAKLTYDGYFALCVPVDSSCTQIGVLFGMHYKIVQIESVAFVKSFAFLTADEANFTQDISSQLVFNQMVEKGSGVLECQATSSAVLISVPMSPEPCVLRLVFRPIC